MKLRALLFAFTALIATALTGHSQVTFIFHDGSALGAAGSALDGEEGSDTYELSGFTLTAEAFTAGVSAGSDINGAGSSFGIDGTGDTSPNTQRIDNQTLSESLVFSFDTAGTFDSINLRYIESSGIQEGELVFSGGSTYQLNSVTATGTADIATIGESFTAGQTITLKIHDSAAVGTNFALESFTISASAVPEPSAFAALAGLAMLGFAASRRRVRVVSA